MKIKDLDENKNLDYTKVKLPSKAFKDFRNYAGGEKTMYLAGNCSGYGFMLSPDPPDSKERRLYPLPPTIEPADILEWEVA